jgi:hypothetical protein
MQEMFNKLFYKTFTIEQESICALTIQRAGYQWILSKMDWIFLEVL